MKVLLKINVLIKGILISFLWYACPTSVVSYHKRCFTLPSALKFCEYGQGADIEGIQRVLTKMINRHWGPFAKFDLSSEKIASDASSSST